MMSLSVLRVVLVLMNRDRGSANVLVTMVEVIMLGLSVLRVGFHKGLVKVLVIRKYSIMMGLVNQGQQGVG